MFNKYRHTASLNNSRHMNYTKGSSSNIPSALTSFSKNIVVSQIDPFPTMGPCSNHVNNKKVIKMIGNKQQNIQQLVEGFGCVCGAKAQFKNIVVLLMDKIYRLRDERNSLKQQLTLLLETPRIQERDYMEGSKEDSFLQTAKLQALQEHLQTFKDEEIQINIPVLMTDNLNTDNIEQLFAIHQTQNITQLSETNLLSTPSIDKNEDPSFEIHEPGVLQEKKLNTENNDSKIKDIASFLKNHHIGKQSLENYIEKIQCSKELGKYDEDKRLRHLF